MSFLLVLASAALIALILQDAFEAMILPRRVTRAYRYSRLFYRVGWKLWRFGVLQFVPVKRRENILSYFGPLSLLALIASWMLELILGFALLHWSLGTPLHPSGGPRDFLTYFYLSGTTFSTLGFGDITASEPLGRMLTVAEAALGFGFLACVIGYLPVLYQAFSRREVTISLLDARAGSPPSAAQLLLRASQAQNAAAVVPFLAEWERWAAELLESILSYPLLAYYRSQHDNQSWLSALTAILDTYSLMIVAVKDPDPYQAQLTFAMARHAVVDIALVFRIPPLPIKADRLPAEQFRALRQSLGKHGMQLRDGEIIECKLAELRGMYEPFVNALAQHFLLALPPIVAEGKADNWQSSAWTQRTPGIGGLAPVEQGDHFN
ncbi:MAG: potassium channel family protein [Gemmataceae bacterium]|nr:potassium channel family protein [Gemmataceae bacterium]